MHSTYALLLKAATFAAHKHRDRRRKDVKATPYDELRGQFGARIADIVAEVTDTKFLGKQSRKRLQLSKAGRASAAAQQVNLGHGARPRSGLRRASTSISTGRRQW